MALAMLGELEQVVAVAKEKRRAGDAVTVASRVQ
jgi:hypothetical protein